MSWTYGVAVSPRRTLHLHVRHDNSNLQVFKRDSAGPSCSDASITVQAGSVRRASGSLFRRRRRSLRRLGSSTRRHSARSAQSTTPRTRSSTRLRRAERYDDRHASRRRTRSERSPAASARSRSTSSARPRRWRWRRDGAACGIDNDKDGFFAGQDCNDGNAAIRPGAVEIKGNSIDENCDGLAEPFPTLTAGVASKWDVEGRQRSRSRRCRSRSSSRRAGRPDQVLGREVPVQDASR